MKTYLLIIICFLFPFVSAAQWSLNPANPTIVCSAANSQSAVQSLHDGNGGYYVFWFDDRDGPGITQLYGQRYDVNGISQWTTNGKVIYADTTNDLFHYSVLRNVAGNLFFGITEGQQGTGGDTIRVLKTDPDGNPLWAQPTLVAGKGSGFIYATAVQLIEKDSGVYVGHHLIYTGGSELLYMSRVDDSGNRLWPFNGIQVPGGGYGGFGMVHDAAGGLLIYWKNGNGSGTALGVRRMDENGNFLWAGTVYVTAGTPGVGGDVRGISDNNGGLILTWQEVPDDIKIARLDTTGALIWSGGVLPACVESHSQARCRIILSGNYIFVSWLDSRPPASYADVYIQQFDLNGQPQWTLDGVKGSNVNTYIPHTRMVASDSGSVIYTIDGNVYGFVAQKINADSTLAWNTPGTLLCNSTYNPNYDDYSLLSSTDYGAVAFWSNGYTIYTAKVESNGTGVGINDIKNQNSQLSVYPNPANDKIIVRFIDIPENSKAQVKILNAVGAVISDLELTETSGEFQLNTTTFNEGLYFINVLLITDQKIVSSSTKKFIVNHK